MSEAAAVTELCNTLGTSVDILVRDSQAVGIRDSLIRMILCAAFLGVGIGILIIAKFKQVSDEDVLFGLVTGSIFGVIIFAVLTTMNAMDLYNWIHNPLTMTAKELLQ